MLSQRELKRTMRYSLLSGVAFVFWFQVCSPQSLFNVFIKNHLGAGASGLGLLIAVISMMGVLQIFAVPLFNMVKTPKWLWLITHVIHRLHSFVLAGVAFSVASGGDKETGFWIIVVTMGVSWALTNLTGSGWWSWMADLFPEEIRAEFFGKRSALSNVVNMIWFFAVSLSLDLVPEEGVFLFWGVVFIIGGIGGLADILFHLPMPARSHEREQGVGFKGLWEPLKDERFRPFLFVIGTVLFAVNLSMPFLSPYIVDPRHVGAPNFWLGIQFILFQITWVLTAPLWGLSMDRFGRKPAVVLGVLGRLSWVGFLFLSPTNYQVIIPLASIVTGIFGPPLWDGMQQMMLSLAPERGRVSYVAWFWLVWGVASAGGSALGGVISDAVDAASFSIRGVGPVDGFQVVLSLSLFLCAVALMVLMGIEEGKGKTARYVLARLANPGVVRTYVNMGIIRGSAPSERVVSALRAVNERDSLLLEEVKARLNDPDEEVRREAIQALARLRASSAVDLLVSHLRDDSSSLRVEAARALGAIGDPRAIPALIEGLTSSSPELQLACTYALGEIGGEEAAGVLLSTLKDEESPEHLKVSGATAAAKLGVLEAAWEIIPLMHRSPNRVLKTQLAIALANLLGRPGEFYRLVTGGEQEEVRERMLRSLPAQCSRLLFRMGLPSKEVETIRKGITEAVDLFLEGRKEECRETLGEVGKRLVLLCAEARNVEEGTVFEKACRLDQRLGVWWWLLKKARETDDPGQLELDLLVLLYALGVMEIP
ncbi:MFS transporter [Spirochaeta thermophila]|uniref:Major facilitator superfamily MFS_1 n=1 Tax=Winmispira thermophila (strain ATCC 49972 / DSM 6192 / RI 19.B1) TaxID=665571 RepID=E0RU35_WINT6|nr:MFS transporter [Spirochaeta thermophila]ADN01091.1 major facilitator superfamily MFS_1 [Spirochaeta thermophila DSM 6192]